MKHLHIVSIFVNQVFILATISICWHYFFRRGLIRDHQRNFEEIGQTRVAVPHQFSSLLTGTGQILIHHFFVTNASSILFHLAPCPFFLVL